jgi:pentatricopeptide repeat protein
MRRQGGRIPGRWQRQPVPRATTPPFSNPFRIWLSSSSLTPTSEENEVSYLSWDDATRQFLRDSSSQSSSSSSSKHLFRQAQAVIDQLVSVTEEDTEEEQNESVTRKKRLPSAPNTNHKNVSLAFAFLDRMLEREQEAIVGDGGYIIMSHNDFNNECLNAVLKLWRESKDEKKNNALSPDQVLGHLDNYRSARSSSLWIPDVQSYNILLDGAAIRGQVEFCQRLYQWMWEESKQDSLLRPDVVTIRTMFKAHIRASRRDESRSMEAPQACEALAEDWKRRSQSSSTQGIYQSLIHAWAHSDPLQSEVYLKTMAQRCLEGDGEEEGPDTVAWNRVISAYAIGHGQPYKAAQLLEEFWHYSQLLGESGARMIAQPDLFSYNSVLEGWARASNYKEANKTFTRLQTASSTAPNIISYTSAIKANGTNWERVQELATECIQAYQAQEQSVGVEEEDSKRHLVLDHPFFHVWLQTALQAGGGSLAVRRALSILDQMRALQIQPDTKSCLTLLQCYLQDNDDIEGATKWFMENAKTDLDESSIPAFVGTVLTMVDDISIIPPLIQFPRRRSISLLQAICEQNFLTRPENVERLLSRLSASQGQAMLQWMKHRSSTKAYSIVLRNMAKEANGPGAESIFGQWKDQYSDGDNTHDDGLSMLADMYTSLVMAWSKVGNVVRCKFWLQEWLDSDHLLRPPDKRVQTAILSAYAHAGDAQGAQDYLHRFRSQGEDPDVVMYNIVLNAFAKSGSSQRAQEYLEQEMNVRDIFSYNTIIHAHAREGNLELARKCVEQVVDLCQREKDESSTKMDHRCQPDLATFRPLLAGVTRSQDLDAAERAEELLHWMNNLYQQGVLKEAPDSHCYQLVMDAWANSKAPGAARQAEEIMRDMIPAATTLSYATVMRAYKRNPGRKQALLDEMYGAYLQGNQRLKPTAEVFLLVLEDLAKTSPERAESFLRRMTKMYEEGLNTAKPTRKAYNVVLKSWAQSPKNDPKAAKRAEALLRQLQSRYLEDGDPSLQPSMESYKAVLTILSKQKKAAMLESLFGELFGAYSASTTSQQKTSLKPDAACINALFLAYRSTNNVSKAQKFLAQLEEWKDTNVLDTKLTVKSYNFVLACMASRGLAEESESFVLQHMKDRGIQPDVVSYNTVMTAWSRTRLPEAGSRVESLLHKMAVPADAMTFSILLRAVVKSNGSSETKEQLAEAIIQQMKVHGFEPTARDLKLLSVAKAA